MTKKCKITSRAANFGSMAGMFCKLQYRFEWGPRVVCWEEGMLGVAERPKGVTGYKGEIRDGIGVYWDLGVLL